MKLSDLPLGTIITWNTSNPQVSIVSTENALILGRLKDLHAGSKVVRVKASKERANWEVDCDVYCHGINPANLHWVFRKRPPKPEDLVVLHEESDEVWHPRRDWCNQRVKIRTVIRDMANGLRDIRQYVIAPKGTTLEGVDPRFHDVIYE